MKTESVPGWAPSLIGLAGAGYLFLQHAHRPTASAMATAEDGVPVIAAVAQTQDVPLIVRGIGTVQAYNMVVIKTRVDGAIVKVSFTEGQDVKAGDPLFQIDPRPFQAALDQAQAAKERNEAQLVSAELDLYRDSTLSKEGYQSRQSFDEQTAVVRALKGLIASDEAAIANARLNLDYADIRAPFDGRTGTRLVDIGNLVQAAQATSLVSITQVKPIFVNFTVPQNVNDQVREKQAAGPLAVIALGDDARGRAGARRGLGDRQPDRHHDRHAPAEGHLPERRPEAVAGTVRQRPPGARRAQGRHHRAAARGDAGTGRLLRLCREARRHRRAADPRARRHPGRHRRHPARHRRRRDGGHRGPVPADRRRARADRPRQSTASAATASRATGCREDRPDAMSLSEWYIRRPIATSLLMVGLLVLGSTAYTLLPVAALPDADFPTISVGASLPGASPETMATSVATPLEMQFSAIPGLVAMTSWSGLGNTSIILQFALDRSADGAATDVQTAINAAGGLLPRDLPNPPTYRKINPSDRPVLIYAVWSDDLPIYKVDDFAYTILAQQIQSAPGVGQVAIAGQQDFAVRIRANPAALAAHGIGLEEIRGAIATATTNQAKGTLESKYQSLTLDANDQLFGASGYRDIIVAFRNGAPVKIRDIADVVDGARMPRSGAWYNGKKAEILLVYRQPGANATRIVDQVRAMMPQLLASLPTSMHVDLISDGSLAIDESIADVKFTLMLTIGLVVLVIFLFLRHFWATVIPSIAVPLALVCTFAVMYPLGYSINNLTLMALTIAVGFVVDDAIVMIENIVRHIEKGDTPLQATLKGAGEIGFTIVSITISLVAVFIPLLLMGGMVGVLFREFAVTVTAAVVMSAFVSLTLTPVMCARLLRPSGPAQATRPARQAVRGRLRRHAARL